MPGPTCPPYLMTGVSKGGVPSTGGWAQGGSADCLPAVASAKEGPHMLGILPLIPHSALATPHFIRPIGPIGPIPRPPSWRGRIQEGAWPAPSHFGVRCGLPALSLSKGRRFAFVAPVRVDRDSRRPHHTRDDNQEGQVPAEPVFRKRGYTGFTGWKWS